MDSISLHILSPEGTLIRKKVSSVTLPGVQGPFTVLKGHAALMSALEKGPISYVSEGKAHSHAIESGFAKVADNQVIVCAEQ